MKLLICAGMTGGGIYPALAVLQTLRKDPLDILWVGSEGGMENELISRLDIPFKTISAAGLHGVGLARLPGNLRQLWRGYRQARHIIADFQPDIFFSTGGYLSVPVALAAKNTPQIVFIPDIEPGLALKVLIRSADQVLTSTTESERFIPSHKNVIASGYPLREEVTRWTREAAQKEFNLSADLPVLLVFGGSQGARSINQALFPCLPALLQKAQVVHISGTDHWEETSAFVQGLDNSLGERYHPFPYLHENMGAALAAADLVVCRAGASTLGELPYFSLPAILVPYPYAWRYQKTNAEHLVKAGGALIMRDEELPGMLRETISKLLAHPDQLEKMKAAMRAQATPDAAQTVANIIRNLYETKQQKGAQIHD
ncbi:MAG: undecaprenyldiphospho-muramoylpentapeptide beta-N-acetylglucosaminyltransferase [Chloroflexi bacterium]|nr:undecaprenyldiphospho-muramoylpentapeptide beta-N-acetylglucosaminyltransferase [Chloroflexota bacterium]